MDLLHTNLKDEYLLYDTVNRSNNLYANLWINVRTGEVWVRSYTLLVPDHYRFCDDYPDIRVTNNYNGAVKKTDYPHWEEVLRRVDLLMEKYDENDHSVAPRTGAWIEIEQFGAVSQSVIVAPRTGDMD